MSESEATDVACVLDAECHNGAVMKSEEMIAEWRESRKANGLFESPGENEEGRPLRKTKRECTVTYDKAVHPDECRRRNEWGLIGVLCRRMRTTTDDEEPLWEIEFDNDENTRWNDVDVMSM